MCVKADQYVIFLWLDSMAVAYEIVTELTKFEITNFQVLIYRNDLYFNDKKSVYTNGNKTKVFYHPEALLISNLEMDMVSTFVLLCCFLSAFSVIRFGRYFVTCFICSARTNVNSTNAGFKTLEKQIDDF